MSGGDAVFWDIIRSSGVISINVSRFPVVLGPWVIVGKWGSSNLSQLVVSWENEGVWGTNLVHWLRTGDGNLSNLFIGGDTTMSC